MDEAIQVVNRQATFTLQWEGEKEPGIPVALDVLLEANQEDEDLCRWLREAPVAGTRMFGGGAAPMCWMRRVS